MARQYVRGIVKDETVERPRFALNVNYSIIVLNEKLTEMINVYETMKDGENTDSDFRKQKSLILMKILEVQQSIKILETHQK